VTADLIIVVSVSTLQQLAATAVCCAAVAAG